MSRRDTIIIAVLVNAGLLMVLFATAMSSKDDVKEKPQLQIVENNENLIKSINIMPEEEMDNVLNQYITISPPPMNPIEDTLNMPQASSAPIVSEIVKEKASEPSLQISAKSNHSSTESQLVSIVIKKGDYLDKIAKNNGSTVSEIMKINHLDSTQLKIGQIIKVPAKTSQSQNAIGQKEIETKPTSIAKTANVEYYTVKNGDNPWLIASKNQIKLEELLRLNNLDDQKAKKLKPGDKLRIR